MTRIVVDDLSGPEIAAFLAEHVEEMRSLSPPESKHALDLDGLRQPDVTFWSVLDYDGTLVGAEHSRRWSPATRRSSPCGPPAAITGAASRPWC